MEPIWGIAAAILIFHEQKELSIQFFVGLFLILFAVIIFLQLSISEASTTREWQR
jgi:hypothetical protein